MSSGMSSGSGAAGSGGGTVTVIVSAALTRWPGSRILPPPIDTWLARISALRRERDREGMRRASRRSRRSPASASVATTVSTRPSSSSSSSDMSNPNSDDEPPLDPAQAKIVAKVRWLMLISGFATVLGSAVVIGVIGYRFFRTDESTSSEMTALLPKGARVVSPAVAETRIVVTLDVGGLLEIRTFDLKTLKPAGRLRFATEP